MNQRGGTLLGLIIGLVLGLGIALGVAVYVTKVPVPFMNKSQSRSAEQDAAEAKKNKDWDPNAPLYGKNPAKPAVVEAPEAPATPATSAATPTPPVPAVVDPKAAKAEVKADPKADVKTDPKNDPLGDLAKAKADPFNYFIQTGAFRTEDDAQAQRAKLALGGMDAKITEREQSGRMVYRVRVGPFEKRDDADKVKDKLEAGGYETVIVRIQK